MASGKQLKCGLIASLSDSSNAMSSSGSAKLQCPVPLISAANSVKSFHGSGTDSTTDSSSLSLEPVYLIGGCFHASAQFVEQHRATLRGQPLPIHDELAEELGDIGACCHLEKANCQLTHHSEIPNFLPRHRRIGDEIPEVTPIEQALAEASEKASAAAADVRTAKKLPTAKRESKTIPPLQHLQSLRKFTTQTSTIQTGQRSILSATETETIAKHKVVRRMMRMFHLPESDVQTIVDGIYEKRGRNISETKRIVYALLTGVTTGAARMEKRSKSIMKQRPGQPGSQLGESVLDSSISSSFSSMILSRDTEGLSRLESGVKSSDLSGDNQLVCCTELEGSGQVTRTLALETIIELPQPPPFELVRTWKFEEAPVRRLRKPLLV